MNIVDESLEIFAIRVDHNRGAYSKYHLQQFFSKEKILIVNIIQDFEEKNIHNKIVFRVYAEDVNGIVFEWQKIVEPTNAVITYKQPNKSDLEMLNEFYESLRNESNS